MDSNYNLNLVIIYVATLKFYKRCKSKHIPGKLIFFFPNRKNLTVKQKEKRIHQLCSVIPIGFKKDMWVIALALFLRQFCILPIE